MSEVFQTFPVLASERLRLRRIVDADRPALAELLSDPQVIRYLLTDAEGTAPTQWPMIDWADGIFSRGTGIRWAVTLKGDDRLIGTCGFHLWNADNRHAEVGYELNSRFWRQGIMREALSTVLDFCFNRLDLHRVEADVTVGNEASAGLLRALGFTHEGTWRERVLSGGQFYDLWQFGLLREEWR